MASVGNFAKTWARVLAPDHSELEAGSMRPYFVGIVLLAVGLPSMVAAQGDGVGAGSEVAPPDPTSPEEFPAPEVGTDAAAPGVPAPVPPSMTPAMADRSYNLPAGTTELRLNVPVAVAPDIDTLMLIGFGGGYGMSDRLELGGNVAFVAIPSNSIAPLFAGYARMQLAHTEAVSASLGTQLTFSPDLDGVVLSLGVSARYRFTRQLSLFTESGICGSCADFLGPVTGQVIIALASGSAAFAVLPVGVGFQATPDAYLYASLPLAAFNITDGEAALIVRDAVILSGGGWLTVRPKIDLGIQLTGDIKQLSDALLIGFSARFRI